MLFLHLRTSIYYPQFFLSTYLSHYVSVLHGPHSLLWHTGESPFSYIAPFILQSAMFSIRAINCWGLDWEDVKRNRAIVDRPMDSKLATVTAKPTLGASYTMRQSCLWVIDLGIRTGSPVSLPNLIQGG